MMTIKQKILMALSTFAAVICTVGAALVTYGGARSGPETTSFTVFCWLIAIAAWTGLLLIGKAWMGH
jgi:hypothetical protein